MNIDTGDTAWILTSAALVLLMTPALGFFYGGMVRKKTIFYPTPGSRCVLGLFLYRNFYPVKDPR